MPIIRIAREMNMDRGHYGRCAQCGAEYVPTFSITIRTDPNESQRLLAPSSCRKCIEKVVQQQRAKYDQIDVKIVGPTT